MKFANDNELGSVPSAVRSKDPIDPPRGATAIGPSIESLESRTLLSKIGPVIDAGDSFYNYTEHRQESLYRVTDQIAVGLGPASAARTRRLRAALVAKTGPLAGYQVGNVLNASSILLYRTARGLPPTLDALQARAAAFPNLKFLAPTFIRDDGTRTAAYDQVYVDLKDDADPAFVFAKGFASWKPSVGTNAYDVILRRGGGLDALRVSAKLRTSPFVEAVEPDLTLELTPSSVPATRPPLAAAEPVSATASDLVLGRLSRNNGQRLVFATDIREDARWRVTAPRPARAPAPAATSPPPP